MRARARELIHMRKMIHFFFAGWFFRWVFQLENCTLRSREMRAAGRGGTRSSWGCCGDREAASVSSKFPPAMGNITPHLFRLSSPSGHRWACTAPQLKRDSPFLAGKGSYLSHTWLKSRSGISLCLTAINKFNLELLAGDAALTMVDNAVIQ